MSVKTIKLIVFITLLVHGVGHLQGVISGMGVKFTHATSNQSWLLEGIGDNANRTLCMLLYLAAAISALLTALAFKGIFLPSASWQALALITAILSAVSLILFPAALAMFFNKVGAIAVNLIIFYSILFNGNWPSAIFDE